MSVFTIEYNDWAPEQQRLRETLCTLGNGYIATRGAAEESSNSEFNYPGTYLAGGFNRAKTIVADRTIENEDFVNFPNWLFLSFRPVGGEWLSLDQYQISAYRQTLDMEKGILERKFTITDSIGRRSSIQSRRLVSMSDKHTAGIEWSFTAENWSGEIEVCSALDGTVINDNVPRYRDLESNHLLPVETRQINDSAVLLVVQTKQSRIIMAQAAKTMLYDHNKPVEASRKTDIKKDYIGQILRFEVKERETYTVEKTVVFYTSRDRAISEPSYEACKNILRVPRFEKLILRHQESYRQLWYQADIGIIGGENAQRLLRLHIFHILQTVSPHTIGLDVGVPARGLHGEAYRGHIFWDELFIYPYLNLRFPALTRSLLMYRFYRLEEARHAAKEEGYKGAMYPWQSGSNGREESQELHLNPESGRWIPDNTHLQRHVNAAIAFNIWNYYLATDDQYFLSYFGAEMFFNIASFWASKATFNKDRQRYEIHGVVGPDEFHTAYPGSEEHGLRNNAYTNLMAAWVLGKALEIVSLIEKSRSNELLKKLSIGDDELFLWNEISKKMWIPFLEKEEGVIAQFEGYGTLKELPWKTYKEKYKDIHRLDRILEKEGGNVNEYKASKQADVLMLFYLFSRDQIKGVFKRLGYDLTDEMISRNIDYYAKRTTHGSTLSRVVFLWICSKYGKETSWKNLETLLVSDFEDIQGGTTAEGIHLGAMSGSVDLIQRCYSGLEVGEEALWINPDLPEYVQKITMRIKYRHHWISIAIDHKKLEIAFDEGWSNEIKIGVVDQIYTFNKGEVREFELKSD